MMGENIDRCIRCKVSLVVVVVDDFTNKIIKDAQVQVLIPGKKLPIYKKEGYYVFTNLWEKEVDLLIKGGIFNSCQMKVDLTTDNAYKMVTVRLMPGSEYRIPKGTTCLSGKGTPGMQIEILLKEIQKPYKLLSDYNKETDQKIMGIFHLSSESLVGKMLLIEDGIQSEFFRVSELKEEKKYLISKVLDNNYKKIGTNLYTVYHVECNEQGQFFFPVKCDCKKDCFSNIQIEIGKKDVEKRCTYSWKIELGKVNWIDFLKEVN